MSDRRGRVDYKNAIVYCLYNDIDDYLYVGSTATTKAKRFYQHKITPVPGVKAHYDAIGWQHLKIHVIEPWPCSKRRELRIREQYWIDLLNPVLNRNISACCDRLAFRTVGTMIECECGLEIDNRTKLFHVQINKQHLTWAEMEIRKNAEGHERDLHNKRMQELLGVEERMARRMWKSTRRAIEMISFKCSTGCKNMKPSETKPISEDLAKQFGTMRPMRRPKVVRKQT